MKLGKLMYIASIILFIGWVLYKLCQEGAIDEAILILVVALFFGGITLAAISDKY